MITLSLRSLIARRGRFASTVLAVLLGTAFVAGTLVLTDTLRRSIEDTVSASTENVDAFVRSPSVEKSELGDQRARVPADAADLVATVPGVAAAEPFVEGAAQIVTADGDAIDPGGIGSTLGMSWLDSDELNPFAVVEGRPPTSDHEVVIDRKSAREGNIHVGDQVTIVSRAPAERMVVAGIATYGDDDRPIGSTAALFTPTTAARLIGEPGRADGVLVLARDGVTPEELRDRVATAIGPDYEVLTGEQIRDETNETVGDALASFSTFLLVFAAVALLVGAFIIFNTFSIVVTQQSRELALLRAIGASRRQVRQSVLVQGSIIAALGTSSGLVAGIGVAAVLRSLLQGAGVDIPAGSPVVATRTVIVTAAVGTFVTLAAVLLPARRVGRTRPIAALRETAAEETKTSVGRSVVGGAITAAGGLLVLAAPDEPGTVGLSALMLVIGVMVMGPLLTQVNSSTIGRAVSATRRVTGGLARRNLRRSPRRAATSAAALMIGVALVVGASILGRSATATIDHVAQERINADFVVSPRIVNGPPLSDDVVQRAGELDGVDHVIAVREGAAKLAGSTRIVTGSQLAVLDEALDLGVTSGTLTDDPASMAVSERIADEHGWRVGDTVSATFAETGATTLTVSAIYDGELVGDVWIPMESFASHFPGSGDQLVFVTAHPGQEANVEQALDGLLADVPAAELQDRDAYAATLAEPVHRLVSLVYTLLALAVAIAVLGILNTLALSIVERTRELGLLRAIGATRRQVRSMVRLEGVLLALQGTAVGLALGGVLGWGIVHALRDDGITQFAISWPTLVVVGLLGALTGILAGSVSTRRVSRLPVLDAVRAQ